MLLVILVVSSLSAASALTASPASKTIAFSANEVVRYDVLVRNDESSALEITISPTGALAIGGALDVPPSVVISPGESRAIPVQIRLPANTVPGTSESGILFESRAVGAGTVAASSAVMHVIRVQTAKEGAFLTGELLSSSGIVGSEVLITLHLLNVGTQSISTQSSILLDGVRQEFAQVTILPGESRDLVASWNPRAVGVYTAVASVPYGSTELRVTSEIIVGALNVKILGINFGEFRLGDPFRVSVDVLNEWGAPLPVQAMFILEQNSTIGTATSASQTIMPLAEGRFTGFLETKSATAGPAVLRAKLIYADKVSEETRPIILGVDSIERPVEVQPGATSNRAFTIVLVILLTILAAYFIYRFYTRKDRN